jgi:DNA-binding MarR family transcriptional regulator
MKAESNLGGLLGKSSRLLANHFNNDLNKHALTIAQWSLLAVLWDRDHQSQKELQEELLKDKATITSLITYLIKSGFISKSKDINDKRSYIVSLTDKGRSIQKVTIPIAIQNITLATQGITQRDLETTSKVLTKVIINLTKENP